MVNGCGSGIQGRFTRGARPPKRQDGAGIAIDVSAFSPSGAMTIPRKNVPTLAVPPEPTSDPFGWIANVEMTPAQKPRLLNMRIEYSHSTAMRVAISVPS